MAPIDTAQMPLITAEVVKWKTIKLSEPEEWHIRSVDISTSEPEEVRDILRVQVSVASQEIVHILRTGVLQPRWSRASRASRVNCRMPELLHLADSQCVAGFEQTPSYSGSLRIDAAVLGEDSSGTRAGATN